MIYLGGKAMKRWILKNTHCAISLKCEPRCPYYISVGTKIDSIYEEIHQGIHLEKVKLMQQYSKSSSGTVFRNHNRIVCQKMSFWTALTWNIGMKTTFQTKHIKSKHVQIFIIMIINFHNITRKCLLISLNMHFIQSPLKF